MAKEKVTLTLDTARLQQLRQIAGSRSLSAAVDEALLAHLARLRHLAAVDEWLAELDRDHGAVPPATAEWAKHVVDEWESSVESQGRHDSQSDVAA